MDINMIRRTEVHIIDKVEVEVLTIYNTNFNLPTISKIIASVNYEEALTFEQLEYIYEALEDYGNHDDVFPIKIYFHNTI
jgi:hypothetical protein